MTCDCCHEEWEAEFFCEICSTDGEFRQVRRPVTFYDGSGDDSEIVEEYVCYATCLNCCPGHKPAAKGRTADGNEG